MDEFQHNVYSILSSVEKYDINDFYKNEIFPENPWKFIMKNVFHDFFTVDSNEIDAVQLIKTLEVLGYSSDDGGLNFSIGAHLLASVIPINDFANNNLKQEYLTNLLNGNQICCNAITESEAGSDIFSMSSTGEKQQNEYLLNATKTFCSNIREADVSLIYVLTDKNKGAHGGISLFLLDKNEFSVGQVFHKMGLRTCSIGELIVKNVTIPDSKMIGKPGAGMGIFSHAMNWERIGLSASHVGTMQKLFEQSVAYAKIRKQGGLHIGKYQSVSNKLAEMKTIIHTSRLLVYDAAKKLNKERNVAEYASMCKYYVSESLVKISEYAMSIHGGNGYLEDYGIERALRDAHASTIYSGTNDIQKNIIARWNGL